VIHTAYDNGVTLFDHADLYAFGKAKAVFGEVLKQSPGLRNKIVIQSKCGQVFPDGWKRGDPIGADLSRKHILDSAEASLRRLDTDRLDILLLHVADALMQPDEVGLALEELHQSGKVRYFGVSNHNAAQM
jgi:predicted oxidoreductase